MADPSWPPGPSEMARRVREHDWTGTPIGPIERWPQSLRTVVDVVLAMPVPATVLWGVEHVQIYNDAYLAVARDRHPALLGRPVAEGWPDAYQAVIAPLLDAARAGQATRLAGFPVTLRGPGEPSEVRSFDTEWSPIRDEEGAVTGVLQTLREVTEGHRIEAALRASEARYRAFVTASSDVVYRMSPDWTEMRELDGRGFLADTSEPNGSWMDRYILPEDQEAVGAAIDQAIRNKATFEFEHRVRQADGTVGWTHSRAVPVLDGRGEVVEWLGAARDVTGRREAEAALRESENLRRIALEGGRMGTWRWDLRSELIWGDAAFLEMWGLPPTEEPRPLSNFAARMSDEGEAEMSALVSRAVAVGEEFDGQLKVVGGPTAGRWVRWRGVAERDRSWFLNGVSFDVTEQRHADQRLRDSEERLRVALAAADLGAFVWHVAEDRTEADARALAHFGLPPDGRSTLAEALATRIHPEDGPRYAAAVERALDPAGPGTLNEEFRIRRPDGQERWMSVSAVSSFEGTPRRAARITGALADVTDRKQAEAMLRASEERQAFLLKLSDALRAEAGVEAVSEKACRLIAEKLGLDRVYLVTLSPGDGRGDDEVVVTHEVRREDLTPLQGTYWSSDFPNAIREIFERTIVYDDVRTDPRLSDLDRVSLAGLSAVGFIAASLRRGHETMIWAAGGVSTRPRPWTAGEVALFEDAVERGWAAVERARAEAGLREREEQLQDFGEASSDVIWIRDAGTLDWTYLSPAFERIYGMGRDEALSGDTFRNWLDLVVPEDREHARAMIMRAVAGERVTFEYHVRRPVDGAIRTLRNTDFPIRDASGRVARIGGVGHDATTEVEAEAALAASEERVRLALDTGRLATWDWDLWTDTVLWNDAHYRMQGYEVKEVEPSFEAWRQRVHPEDLKATLAALDHARVRRTEYAQEFRNLTPGGETRWVSARGRFFHDEAGRPVRMIGVMEDVTERLQARRAVAASEVRLRTLTEGIPQLVWTAVDGGHWTWSSPQWSAFTGLSAEDSLGLGWLAALHPDDRAPTMAVWKGAMERGVFEAEYRLRHVGAGPSGAGSSEDAAEGPYRWFQTRAAPVRDEAGQIVEWLGTSTDVQDLREMQERQGVLVAELQHRTRNLLGVVRSTMSTTLRERTSLEEFVPAYRDRLDALARVNGLLSRLGEDDRVAFDELIVAELAALGAVSAAGQGERVTLDGPKGVRLRSSTVQTFALALHELATNAVKYGALMDAQPGGHLAVRWRRTHDPAAAMDGPRLRVEWTETGVAMPERGAAPRGSGYGRELIERALPYQLKAETSYELGSDGVRCTITLPLSFIEEPIRG